VITNDEVQYSLSLSFSSIFGLFASGIELIKRCASLATITIRGVGEESGEFFKYGRSRSVRREVAKWLTCKLS
jgi:hypothetical protein